MGANVGVEAPQEQGAAINLGNLRAQAVEDSGEFHRDIAAANDDQALGEMLQVEYFVGGNGILAARERGDVGPAAGGDEDFVGGELSLAHDHGVSVDDAGPAIDHIGLHPGQQVVVNGVEAGNFGFLVIPQGGPVESGFAAVPAKIASVAEGLGVLRGVNVQFLGHATHVDAGAAHVAILGHRHPRTERRGHAGSPDATGARADDKKIVVEVIHDTGP